MPDYRASSALFEAFDIVTHRLATIRYELETVGDIEKASRIAQGLEKDAGTITARIEVIDRRGDVEQSATSSHAQETRSDGIAPENAANSGRFTPGKLATYFAVFVAGAVAMMAIRLGSALADMSL